MPGIATEVVAGSNASQTLIFSSQAFANTQANGSAVRVTAGGFVSPGQFGSEQYFPNILVNVYVGANGTSADPLMTSFQLPSNQNITYNGGPSAVQGHFSFETLIMLRANAKSAGPTANAVYTGMLVNPFAVQAAVGSNGSINAVWTGGATTNLANVSVYATAGNAQGANLVFQHCFITQQS